MLSILIPTYNYNVYNLVTELHRQCNECGIEFEIIALDDSSKINSIENQQINKLNNCRFLINDVNVGRGATINKLVQYSNFEYLLILEADSFPCKKNYISLYNDFITKTPQAVFGGVLYDNRKPNDNSLLRWTYGHARESKNLKHRIKNPNDIVFSWNLLLQKKLFLDNPFDSLIRSYGFEDLVFLKNLKKNNVSITQIDNPCFHQNQEQSIVFIEKSKIAILNLVELYKKKILNGKDSSLLRAFTMARKFHISSLIVLVFERTEDLLESNLLSTKPSLLLFDFYRLGHFSKNYLKKKEIV